MSNFLKSSFIRLPKHRRFDYTPIYYDKDKEERDEKRRSIRFERGAFYNQDSRSRIVGAFTERDIAFRERTSTGSQVARVFLLAAMLTVPTLIYLDVIKIWIGVPFLLILMILFVMRVNRL